MLIVHKANFTSIKCYLKKKNQKLDFRLSVTRWCIPSLPPAPWQRVQYCQMVNRL